jgi:GPI mannosyltransferase 2
MQLMEKCRNVGLFRYWTLSNAPLFLLAAPTIFVLCKSSIWALSGDQDALDSGIAKASRSAESDFHVACLRRLAVPQVLLASMALLSYHVQIVTRLSSAYPLWYIWLFSKIKRLGRKGATDMYHIDPKTLVRWMVIYAMVQAALFASFLPPA